MRWSSVVPVQRQKFHVSVMSQISWKAMKIRRNPKSWSGNKTPNRATIYIRKGLTPHKPITRAEFHARFNARFYDSAVAMERVARPRGDHPHTHLLVPVAQSVEADD
jgi:hypothetical protein